jgi:ectoine hydroxylase-related dioxygenase (phytanoyl-CoA dioxygenase family)
MSNVVTPRPEPGFAFDRQAEQREALLRDGFVVVPALFDEEEIARISDWTDDLERRPDEPGRAMKYFEPSLLRPGERVLQRIENFCPFHDGFAELCDGEKLRGSVARLLGEAAVLFKDKINFKLPGGDGFKPHQDQQAGWSAYADLFVTAMVSIDATTAENGCLELCAGHHTRGLLGEEWEPLTADDMRRLAGRPVPTRPGDAVFFDSYTPHASGPNLTAERRRVLYITYNRRSVGDHRVRYYADKRKSFPPDIERDPSRTYTFRV